MDDLSPMGDGRRARVARRGKPIRKEKKMIRNLKALGLALVAVFAMSAMAASAASAQNGTLTADGPVTLKGVNRVGAGEFENSLTAFNQKVICPNAVYTGHETNSTNPPKKIPNGSTTATITVNYGTCQIGATIKATVDMNGCDYLFHLTTTSVAGGPYKVTTTVVCPEGKHIVLTLFTTAAFHAEENSFCHIIITEKKSYDGLLLKDNGNNTFGLTGTIEGIEAHKERVIGTTGDNGILCPSETTTTGILHVDVTVSETSGTPMSLSHT